MELHRYLLALLFASIVITSASAAETGAYWGLGLLAPTDFDLDKQAAIRDSAATLASQGATGAPFVLDSEDSDNGFGIYFGYRLNRFLAIETEYVNLGNYEINVGAIGTQGANPASLTSRNDIDVESFSVSALGHLPTGNNSSVFVKAGAALWELDREAKHQLGVVVPPGVVVSTFTTDKFSENGTSLLAGVGWEVRDRGVAFRIGFDRYFDIGESNTTGQGDIDRLSLNLQFYL